MLKIVRLAASVILIPFMGVIFVALVESNVDEFAKAHHLNDFLIKGWAYMPSLPQLLILWWFWLLLGAIGGLAMALWLVRLFPADRERPSDQVGPPQYSATPSFDVPDWTIRDLFYFLSPSADPKSSTTDLDDEIGAQFLDKASTGQLSVWGREITRDFGGAAYSSLVPIGREYWKNARLTYVFLLDDRERDRHADIDARSDLPAYGDLQVNRAQAEKIWPSATNSSSLGSAKIIFGNGGAYETKKASGLYKTTHTFLVGIKNANPTMFLSNCKLHANIVDPKTGHPRSYLLVDTFTLNASEERSVSIVSFDEPASVSNHIGKHIRFHIPVVGGFYGVGSGWPWQMPIGAYAFTLRLTCKEAAPHEVACKVWVDDASKLHFERA